MAGVFMLYIYYVLYKMLIFILVGAILIPCFLINYVRDKRNKSRKERGKRTILNNLVVIQYLSQEFEDSNNSECAICLEAFLDQQDIIILP
mmetsp:Transcript_10220/g.9028  ORF Transcript_10220/g.9028 Transcript_10220/m.9028 type:complete len:91 (-) Transcript_10220:241-513(-)